MEEKYTPIDQWADDMNVHDGLTHHIMCSLKEHLPEVESLLRGAENDPSKVVDVVNFVRQYHIFLRQWFYKNTEESTW